MVTVNFFGRNQPLIHALDLLNQHQRAETRSASASDDEATRRLCHYTSFYIWDVNAVAQTTTVSLKQTSASFLLRSSTRLPWHLRTFDPPLRNRIRIYHQAADRSIAPSAFRLPLPHFGLKCEHFIRLPSDLLRVPCEQRNLQL